MSSAFISHSSLDKATADEVVDALERKGISCWIAPRNIPAGSNYGAAIVQAIRDCDVLILLLSESSNTSAAVFREVQKAFEEHKSIIPLRLENVSVSDDLGFYLSGLHWIDADPDQNDFNDLINDVRLALEKTTNSDSNNSSGVATKKNEPRKKTEKSTKNILIATLCIILCLTLAISAFFIINRRTEPTTDATRPTREEENYGQEQQDLVEPTPEPTRLTQDEALQIALNFAEVTREQISDLDIELFMRGDRMVWDVDFEVERYDDDDWEFYIDAYTGEILYWERD
jgi:uncharacterized membrane protein YkoI